MKFSLHALRRAGVLALAGLVSTAGTTFAYLTDSAQYVPLDYYTFVPPSPGSTYLDTNFGSTIKRISAAQNTASSLTGGNLSIITNEYATMSPFNIDNTFLILQHDSYFGLYDGNGTYLKDLPFVVNAGAEPRWSKTNPSILYFVNGNQLKQIDVTTLSINVVHTFSGYGTISGKGESDISEDGKHFVFAGDNRYVFIYDIAADSQSAVFDTGGVPFDSLYVTPDNHATITWYQPGSSRFNGIELFDGNMSFLRQVARAGGHMDVARDTNGDEVLLWANAGDPQPVCNNGIVKIRLSDGLQTCLVTLDWSLATHTSAPDNNGWVFVETYAPSDPSPLTGWPQYTNEILQVKLDGSEIRRVAHHRSRPFDTYYYTPRTSTSHDGSKIVFSSNFGLQRLGYPSLYTDVYMVDIAPGAPGAPGAPTSPGSLTGPTSTTSTASTAARVEQSDPSVTLTGDWFPNGLAVHSGGSAVLSMTPGSRATFTFNGTGASWIAYRDEWSGVARVYVDGSLLGQIDTYAAPGAPQAKAYSVTGLSAATHTLAVEVTGSNGVASSGAWVWVDAFESLNSNTPPAPTAGWLPAPTPNTSRVEQGQVQYTGPWFTSNLATHSGSSAALAMDSGAQATFTFTGTGVQWIGFRDEWSGIAEVILDGQVIGNVDTYLTPAQSQAVTYAVNSLPAGSHTLTIQATGQKNASSGGYWIWVDAFDVTQ